MSDWGKDEKQDATAESMFAFVQRVQAELEVRAGKRAPEEVQGVSVPQLYDSRGNPIPR
jgi:hypothetical protein